MKKIVALVAALAVAGSLFAANEQKTVILTNTVSAQNDFAFLKSAVTDAAGFDAATQYGEGEKIKAATAINSLYVAFKSNSSKGASLSLKAFNFKGGTNEQVGYTLNVGGVTVASVDKDDKTTNPTVVLSDSKSGLRAASAPVTYAAKGAPDFSAVSAADYEATLSLTFSAQ